MIAGSLFQSRSSLMLLTPDCPEIVAIAAIVEIVGSVGIALTSHSWPCSTSDRWSWAACWADRCRVPLESPQKRQTIRGSHCSKTCVNTSLHEAPEQSFVLFLLGIVVQLCHLDARRVDFYPLPGVSLDDVQGLLGLYLLVLTCLKVLGKLFHLIGKLLSPVI